MLTTDTTTMNMSLSLIMHLSHRYQQPTYNSSFGRYQSQMCVWILCIISFQQKSSDKPSVHHLLSTRQADTCSWMNKPSSSKSPSKMYIPTSLEYLLCIKTLSRGHNIRENIYTETESKYFHWPPQPFTADCHKIYQGHLFSPQGDFRHMTYAFWQKMTFCLQHWHWNVALDINCDMEFFRYACRSWHIVLTFGFKL